MQQAALAFLASLAAFVAVIAFATRILAALRSRLGADRMLPPGAFSGTVTILVYVPIAASTATLLIGPPYLLAVPAGACFAAASANGLLTARLVLGALREARKAFRVEGGAARRRRWLRGGGERLHVTRAVTGAGYSCTGPASGYVVYSLELLLSDGGSVTNLYVDEAARDRDLAALAFPAQYRVAAVTTSSDTGSA